MIFQRDLTLFPNLQGAKFLLLKAKYSYNKGVGENADPENAFYCKSLNKCDILSFLICLLRMELFAAMPIRPNQTWILCFTCVLSICTFLFLTLISNISTDYRCVDVWGERQMHLGCRTGVFFFNIWFFNCSLRMNVIFLICLVIGPGETFNSYSIPFTTWSSPVRRRKIRHYKRTVIAAVKEMSHL